MRRLLCFVFLAATVAAVGQPVSPNLLGGLRYRLIGPFRGGRALAVTGVSGSPEKFYFGAVGGGVWVTENAGRTWTPIFDRQHVASIGAIAVAPSNPQILYVGAGEADMRSDIQQGDGMYRSTNAGKNWIHIGLEDSRQIGKILVDPSDPNTLYVAALGHQYGPNEERGVFKSIDGGSSWRKVLYKDPDTGAIDMAMDPADHNVIFASMWQTRRPPWSVYPPSNGPGGGLYRTADAGATWTQIKGHGFPAVVGHIGLSISPSDHNRIYAVVDTNNAADGGIYRSDDGGANWTMINKDHRLWQRGWYFGGVTADPKNSDTVYVMNTTMYRSTDGAKNFKPIKGAPGGDDYHTLWIAPDDPSRMIFASDQGVGVSVDSAKTWSSWYNQPTGQFYHINADNRLPYWVYGSQQDSGAMAIPSRTIHSGISAMDWRPIEVGGESDMVAPDPLHPGVIYGSPGSREQLDIAWIQNIDPTINYNDTVWRSEWTHPIAVSPSDPHVFYSAHQKIFRTADGGNGWQVISPDLTREHTEAPANLDEPTATDDQGLARKGVVYWIAPSPVRAHQIWAGTDDGLIWLTRDEGAHWLNVTPAALASWSKVGIIDASPFDADTAYAAIDRHRLDDNKPYIYRTHDAGKHWDLVTNGIPSNEFVNVVRADPQRKGLLYAGTDWGVYCSFDDGANWQPLQLNLPTASVRDIAFQDGDVIVATHGRAVWILDDPAILRQINGTSAMSDTLYRPARAMLIQHAHDWGVGRSDEGTPLPPEEPQGENPAWGASIDYSLANPGPITLTVLDNTGEEVRKFSSEEKLTPLDESTLEIPSYWYSPDPRLETSVGGHRFTWDLAAQDGLRVPPGAYAVQLHANGKTYSQPLTVVRDPRVRATEADLRAQYLFSKEIRKEQARVAAALNLCNDLLKKSLSPEDAHVVHELISKPSEGTPDMVGTVDLDVTNLSHLSGWLGQIDGAVQSAPAAPTKDNMDAFAKAKARADRHLAVVDALAHKYGVKIATAK